MKKDKDKRTVNKSETVNSGEAAALISSNITDAEAVKTPESKEESVKQFETKKTDKNQKNKQKAKKTNFFVRVGKKIAKKTKEVISELKKVTWPTFPKVVRQTGVVLAVVLFFLLVLFGIDRLLELLFNVFIQA